MRLGVAVEQLGVLGDVRGRQRERAAVLIATEQERAAELDAALAVADEQRVDLAAAAAFR
jgi:hypothetical protein